MSTTTMFGPVDARSLKQLERCMQAGDAEFGGLCADHHPRYSQPIGGAVAYEGYVLAVWRRLRHRLRQQGGEDRIGPGRPRHPGRRRGDHAGDHAADLVRHRRIGAGANRSPRAGADPERRVRAAAAARIPRGVAARHRRVGQPLRQRNGGRERPRLGRRPLRLTGFGHRTASGFLALAQGLPFEARTHEGGMDSPPVLFEADSELGRSYVAAMGLPLDYVPAVTSSSRRCSRFSVFRPSTRCT
jgi:tRNA-splicing ligase RtcB